MSEQEQEIFSDNLNSFEKVVEVLREQNKLLLAAKDEWKKNQRALELSHRFLEIANQHTERSSLFKDIVAEIQHFSGCQAVGLRLLDSQGNIPYVEYSGFSEKFYDVESLLSIYSDQCMCINVIKGSTDPTLSFYTSAGSFYMNGTTRFLATVSEEEKGSTRNVCNIMGYESVALIPVHVGEHIIGLLHLADTRENMVLLHLVEMMESAIQQLGPALKRIVVEEELKKYAETQTVLIKEVNHRVKNNLAAILSIFHIEEERAVREGIHSYFSLLQSLESRIDGLFTLHRMLSSSGWQPLDLSVLSKQVIDAALRTLPGGENVELSMSSTDIKVDSNQAHHLTLIINELASNYCKHVFYPKKGKRLSVTIFPIEAIEGTANQSGNKKISLCFHDNGPGYPENILGGNIDGLTSGLELVYGIVTKNLAGEIRFENDFGAKTTIIF